MPQVDPIDQFCHIVLGVEGENLWDTPAECEMPPEQASVQRISPDWEKEGPFLVGKLNQALTAKWEVLVRIEALERKIILLEEWCGRLEQVRPLLAPIASLAPEPYEVIKPLYVVVRAEEDQYIASFFDANLSASGDTREEAVLNLKDIIATTFEILGTMDESELGSGPLQQRKVLDEFVRRKA